VAAEDMYVSQLFMGMRRYAEQNADAWFSRWFFSSPHTQRKTVVTRVGVYGNVIFLKSIGG
jgi:hypothetical protein